MYELSTYQKNILDYVNNSSGNLLVDAKAGSGKTSTLLLISEELIKQNKKILFLAFNKTIVGELKTKITNTEYCNIKTIHSTGYSFIASYLYKKYGKDKFNIDSRSIYTKRIIRDVFEKNYVQDIEEFNKEDLTIEDIKTLCSQILNDLYSFIEFLRFYMIDYNNEYEVIHFLYSGNVHLDVLKNYKNIGLFRLPQLVKDIIAEIIYRFENPEFNEETGQYDVKIGFTEQLFLPLYFNMYVPWSLQSYLDYVLVDESQDLSILQQTFLKKLNIRNRNTRYIFVGDKKQAIYGFSGADTNSINSIKENFVLKELPLNICYRCPENVIKLAQEIVPDIEWNKQRNDRGIVSLIERETLSDLLKPNDMVLGRKNCDLLDLFSSYVLYQKRKIRFMNKELVDSIYRDFTNACNEYIIRYNKCENIEVALDKYLKANNIPVVRKLRTKDEKKAIEDYIKNLVQANKSIPKVKFNKNKKYTLDYLLLAMTEYQIDGSYTIVRDERGSEDQRYNEDEYLFDYFNIIKSFVYEYLLYKFNLVRKDDYKLDDYNSYLASCKLDDFYEYFNEFLHCTDQEVDVPVLSTIHGMKGSEADRVFILDYPCFPYKFANATEDQLQQEIHLQYVAITRAKKELYLVKIDIDNPKDNKKLLHKQQNEECEIHIHNVFGEDDNFVSENIQDNTNIVKTLNDLRTIITPIHYDKNYFDNKMV